MAELDDMGPGEEAIAPEPAPQPAPVQAGLADEAAALGLDPAKAEAIFERVAREVLEKVVNQSVPAMVAELVAQEIEAIKRDSGGSDSGSSVV